MRAARCVISMHIAGCSPRRFGVFDSLCVFGGATGRRLLLGFG